MQINYVLYFTQSEFYMNIAKGVEVLSDTKLVRKVNKNIYGQRQVGRVWNKSK